MNIRNEPARYMSWLRNASSSIGPVVGNDITTETITAPEITCGNSEPISRDERVERHAQRVFEQHLQRVQALGARGHDILLLQFVEQVGAQPADHAAVPAVPMTMTGIQIWAKTDTTLSQVHGRSR